MRDPVLKRFWRKNLVVGVLVLSILACTLTPLEGANPDRGPDAQPVITETVQSNAVSEIPMQVGYGFRGPFYEIYFTDPTNPAAGLYEGGPDTALVAAIDSSRISVDLAAYSISLYSVRNALINAYHRGVKVRVVMESDNMDDSGPQDLKDVGISLVGDRREGLMHNKFAIIDRQEVWLGSMNFTVSGTYKDNNNFLRIRSSEVAQDYLVEFEEMFQHDFFGPDVVAETPYPNVTIDGIDVEVYFSPDDHAAIRIISLLRNASESIHFMAYSFTANDFGEVLVQKARDGLTVEGVMDANQIKTNTGGEFQAFSEANLRVLQDGLPGLMHHKVFIIDRKIVITGSYNFSASAERTNDENVMIFFDPQIASIYLSEFQRVYDLAENSQVNP